MTWIIVVVFIIGYVFIVFEHNVRLDKAATALITGVLCWTLYSFFETNHELLNHHLAEHFTEIAGILFFLIGAMTIVELIDLYNGFQIVIDKLQFKSKRTLFIAITFVSFFLSAILDNLTTAIVMSSIILKLIEDKQDRYLYLGMVIIASNAGGAWSPIGDVTTTMLWIGNQVTVQGIIKTLFIPSLISTLVPMLILMMRLKGELKFATKTTKEVASKDRFIILFSGIALLLLVPLFKLVTHLPPFMGMLLAVGILWLISETLHKKYKPNSKEPSTIFTALERIDMPSILFFCGILLAVSALESIGILSFIAEYASSHLKNDTFLVSSIGLLSSIFDNVPLVAATQGMFTLAQHETGSFFWNYLAYCSGTGGSILIIGSAAGVAIMGIEKISFMWYVKHISLAALLGYIAGALMFALTF